MALQTELEDLIVESLGTFDVQGVAWTTANTRSPQGEDQVLVSLDLLRAEQANLGDTLEYEGELNFEACGEKSLQPLDHIRQSLLVDNIVLEPSRGTTVLAWTLWKVERGVPDEDGLTLDTAVLEVNYTAEAGA